MKKTILIVDAEEQILKALKRVFLQTDYNVYQAASGTIALDILDKERIDLIITDIRMPELDGYQLLTKVKAMYPEVIRLVLSGYADEKAIFKLLNANLAKMCIYKPWDNQEMLNIIKHVFELNRILSENSILQIINKIDNLPFVSFIYNDLCVLIENDASIVEIEKLLMKDQALSAAILRIVNSAFYNVKTGSLKKAITYIGLTHIKSIAFTAGISYNKALDINLAKSYQLFSKHSLLTNKICNQVYPKLFSKEMPSDSTCVGLLLEIGRVVLMSNFPKQYKKIISLEGIDKRPLYQLEKEILGIAYHEMSSYLLNWWGLPYCLIEATLYHHSPLEDNVINKELTSVLHLANYYAAKLLNFKWQEAIHMDVFNFLNISINDFENLVFEVAKDSEL